jgi:Arc/MetJ-type ribon-helix-helix transcriptional regulator
MRSEEAPSSNPARRVKRIRKKGKRAFLSVSLPTPLVEKIEEVVDELGYWPTKTAFVREATVEKLDARTDKHKKEGRTLGRGR